MDLIKRKEELNAQIDETKKHIEADKWKLKLLEAQVRKIDKLIKSATEILNPQDETKGTV